MIDLLGEKGSRPPAKNPARSGLDMFRSWLADYARPLAETARRELFSRVFLGVGLLESRFAALGLAIPKAVAREI